MDLLDKDGWTPLMIACRDGETEIVKMLANSQRSQYPSSEKGRNSPVSCSRSCLFIMNIKRLLHYFKKLQSSPH